MADQGGLQLLPDTRKKISVSVPGQNRYLYIGIFAMIISLGLYGGVWSYINGYKNSIASLDQQLAALESQRNSKDEANLLTFSKEIGVMNVILNNHLFWTKAMAKINGLVQGQVQVKTISASVIKQDITISAEATSFGLIGRQVAAFLSDSAFTDVVVGETHTLTSGRVGFTMNLKFDSAKLLKK